jgi:hypothetical protein
MRSDDFQRPRQPDARAPADVTEAEIRAALAGRSLTTSELAHALGVDPAAMEARMWWIWVGTAVEEEPMPMPDLVVDFLPDDEPRWSVDDCWNETSGQERAPTGGLPGREVS